MLCEIYVYHEIKYHEIKYEKWNIWFYRFHDNHIFRIALVEAGTPPVSFIRGKKQKQKIYLLVVIGDFRLFSGNFDDFYIDILPILWKKSLIL